MEVKKTEIKLWIKLKAHEVENPPLFYRDMTNIGHYGTGDSGFTIASEEDFSLVKQYIELAYNKVGG